MRFAVQILLIVVLSAEIKQLGNTMGLSLVTAVKDFFVEGITNS